MDRYRKYGDRTCSGDGNNVKDYKIYSYSPENDKLNSLKVMCMYKDELGRIWAGTEGCGLSLYDSKIGKFISVHGSGIFRAMLYPVLLAVKRMNCG